MPGRDSRFEPGATELAQSGSSDNSAAQTKNDEAPVEERRRASSIAALILALICVPLGLGLIWYGVQQSRPCGEQVHAILGGQVLAH